MAAFPFMFIHMPIFHSTARFSSISSSFFLWHRQWFIYMIRRLISTAIWNHRIVWWPHAGCFRSPISVCMICGIVPKMNRSANINTIEVSFGKRPKFYANHPCMDRKRLIHTHLPSFYMRWSGGKDRSVKSAMSQKKSSNLWNMCRASMRTHFDQILNA